MVAASTRHERKVRTLSAIGKDGPNIRDSALFPGCKDYYSLHNNV
ncbi:unnamed protein product [Ectocarpus sp. 6 AP-2014]